MLTAAFLAILSSVGDAAESFGAISSGVVAQAGGSAGAEGIQSTISGAFQRFWWFELFRYQDHPITVGKVILCLLLLIVGGWIAKRLSSVLGRRILPQVGVNNTSSIAFQRVLFYLLLFALALIALNILEVPLTVFTVLGGAIAIGVGFGAQAIINNFISGWILLAEGRVNIGDLIEVDGSLGHVRSIGARCTHVRRSDGIDLLIPNSQMLERTVVNWTLSDQHIRTTVRCGVVYGSPTQKVMDLIRTTVREHERILSNPEPQIVLEDFGDNALVFDVFFWVRTNQEMDLRLVRSDVRVTLDRLFRAEGIEIAFPQRDLHLDTRSPLDVRMIGADTDDSAGTGLHGDQACSSEMLRGVPLFRSVSRDELTELAAASIRREFAAGDPIVEQDQAGSSLFVVGAGMLKVSAKRQGAQAGLGRLLPGDFFGEMSLLTGEPRRATVTATTDAVVYEINHEVMGALLNKRPDIVGQLSKALAQRQSQLDRHAESAEPPLRQQAKLAADIRTKVYNFFGIRDS